jgi:hypothetical protein
MQKMDILGWKSDANIVELQARYFHQVNQAVETIRRITRGLATAGMIIRALPDNCTICWLLRLIKHSIYHEGT